MGGSSNIVVPVVVGLSLCGLTGLMLYLLLKKDDDKHTRVHSSNRRTKEMKIPSKVVPALIGRSGSNIKEIQEKSGTHITFRDSDNVDSEGNKVERICVIGGEPSAIRLAEVLIQESIAQMTGASQLVMSVPGWAAGKIIGRGGENIRDISHTSGAKVKLEDPKDGDLGPASQKQITITGNTQQIALAQEIINQCILNEKKRREEESTRREPRGQYAGSNRVNKMDNVQPSDVGGGGALLEVFVSAVSSPARFWLQIVGPQVEKLDKLVDLMTEYYSNSQNRDLHKLPDVQVGQLVAAVFRHDGKWYRAKVAEIKPNEFDNRQRVCDVHFVDYGDNEYVAVEELVGLRTDMLQLRFQAVECFLAEVAPQEGDKWHPRAIERFEELTQVARWKRLWSRTCSFREKLALEGEGEIDRSKREGSPVPGVKLYDVKDGVDVDIGATLIAEGWAVKVEEQVNATTLPPLQPATPVSPTLPPPSFGDLQSSRVLGMVVSGGSGEVKQGRDERATSLPHSPSPSSTPLPDRHNPDEDLLLGNKSKSLATGMDYNVTSDSTHLSYPKPPQIQTTSVATTTPALNGSHALNNGSHVENGAFINAERKQSNVRSEPTLSPPKETIKPLTRNNESFTKSQPMHVPDPKDELKAKMNRVDSHHGNLEALGRSTPPKVLTLHK